MIRIITCFFNLGQSGLVRHFTPSGVPWPSRTQRGEPKQPFAPEECPVGSGDGASQRRASFCLLRFRAFGPEAASLGFLASQAPSPKASDEAFRPFALPALRKTQRQAQRLGFIRCPRGPKRPHSPASLRDRCSGEPVSSPKALMIQIENHSALIHSAQLGRSLLYSCFP